MTYTRREARDNDERKLHRRRPKSRERPSTKGRSTNCMRSFAVNSGRTPMGVKRTKEFEAIKKVLESDNSLEKTRLKKCREGRFCDGRRIDSS